MEAAACGSKVGAAAADSGGRLVSRTGGYTSSRLAFAAEQEAVVADVPECTLGRAGGGDRCGSRLGPAVPSGVVGSSTRPAISQVSGGRLGAGERAGGPAEAHSARTGGFTSPRAVAAAVDASQPEWSKPVQGKGRGFCASSGAFGGGGSPAAMMKIDKLVHAMAKMEAKFSKLGLSSVARNAHPKQEPKAQKDTWTCTHCEAERCFATRVVCCKFEAGVSDDVAVCCEGDATGEAAMPGSDAPGGLWGPCPAEGREYGFAGNISVAATMPGAFSPGGLCDEHLQEVSDCSRPLVTATMPGGGAPGGLCDNYSQEFTAYSQLSVVATMPGCVAPGGLVDVIKFGSADISVAATMPGAFSPGGLCDEHLQEVSDCSRPLVTATMPGGGAPVACATTTRRSSRRVRSFR